MTTLDLLEPAADPESPSEVLRATHILVILIEDVKAGDWVPEEGQPVKKRVVELTLLVEEILKGETAQTPGQSVIISVDQRASRTSRVADYYGVWSRFDPQPNLRLVAFSASASKDVSELLQPPACQWIDGVEVLPDVRATLGLEARKLDPPGVLAEAAPVLEQRGGIVARYVWARVRPAALADEAVFEALARLIERSDVSPEARDVLISAVHEELSMAAAPSKRNLIRFAQVLLVVLTLPSARALHANVAQVFLPNLLGLARGRAEITAAETFAENPEARARVKTALAGDPELDPEGLLLNWIVQTDAP